MKTGYFVNEKRQRKEPKVHVVDGKLNPICGVKLDSNNSWHWCSHRIHVPYITCDKCKKKVETLESLSPSLQTIWTICHENGFRGHISDMPHWIDNKLKGV